MRCDPSCFFLRHSTSFLSTKYILLFLVDTNFCSTKFFSKIFFVLLGQNYGRRFRYKIKVMDMYLFWKVFTVVFIFIVWLGSVLNIKPFVALWKVIKWILLLIFAALSIDYAKNELKEWWSK